MRMPGTVEKPFLGCPGGMPWCRFPDRSASAERLFASFLVCAMFTSLAAAYGWQPPEPAVHWPGHSWIHFMKRIHVIMSIGAFLIEVCAMCFALFAFHRVLAGGFDARAPSTAVLLVRELEFEFVAVCSYFFAGAMLLMGPVAIRCFCMVQQGLRSNALAVAVCCLIVGTSLLILSFFNAHLSTFPYDSIEVVMSRFVELSFSRTREGGRQAYITVAAWALQLFSVILSLLSVIETFPWYYYGDVSSDHLEPAPESSLSRRDSAERLAPDQFGLDPLGSAPADARPSGDAESEDGLPLGNSGLLHGGSHGGTPERMTPERMTPEQRPLHPWSLALSSAPTRAVLEARGGATLGSANGNGGSASAPLNVRGAAASGGHSRQRSGEVRFTVPHTNGMQRSKNPSIASSMQSLDSTAVD